MELLENSGSLALRQHRDVRRGCMLAQSATPYFELTMTAITKFLSIYLRSRARGSYRTTMFLSERLKSLQSVAIRTEWGVLYADLRISSSHGILADPRSSSGEDLVMKRFVREGDIVFDIGAHLGFYTLLLSGLVGQSGKVYSFEPNAELLPSLGRTVALMDNVDLIQIALSNTAGEETLYIPEDASMASLSDWTDGIGGKVHAVSCEKATIDDLVSAGKLRMPNFIKCDVEGGELSVFKGAQKTLDRCEAPAILFELNTKAATAFGSDTIESLSFIRSLPKAKYRILEVSPSGLRELPDAVPAYTNVVAIPETRL